jgi:hypothetical protein
MRKLLSIFSFVLLYLTVVYGQAVNIPITVSDNEGASAQIFFGLDLTATDDVDLALGEDPLPGLPPGGYFAAWLFPDFTTLSYKDYRAPGTTPPGAFPYTGHKSLTIRIQATIPTGNPMTISWALPPEIAATSTIGVPGNQVSFSGTGSHTWNFNPVNLAYIYVEIDYVGIGPIIPLPEFNITPASLNFGPVGVGLTSPPQPVTVSNTGDADLVISNVTSTNAVFAVTPTTATIPPAGNQVFNVTFTPSALGPFNANLQFDHNATNAADPYLLPVQGVGADAGPTFGVTPSSLTFATLLVGTSDTKQLTVRNDGLSNTLNVTSVTTTNADYTVLPTSATVAPGATQVFNVTFAPSVAGTISGDVVFAHDGPGPTTSVPVTGAGFIPAAVSGLVFEEDTAYVLEAAFYQQKMQLVGTIPGPKIQALQFRLLTNMAVDDQTILTFQNIQKGPNVSDPSWVLDYNLVRGDITANGASEDTIYVLLYNLEQNNGLPTGVDYLDLLRINYRVADLPALMDYAKSSFLIKFAEASTFEGFPVNITPSDDQLQVVAKNRVGSWGDVNGDGCLDILDLIKVVDHIVGRDSLDRTITPGFTTSEFERANIAPWVPGNELPNPDAFVNVQDLSLIQNIILTGFFPNGDPVGPCGYSQMPKVEGNADATLNVYITPDGISVYLDSQVGIRGAQMEFGSVVDNVGNLVINTDLGQGYYLQVEELLRTLMYDRLAEKYIEPGFHFMADMPFEISNYNDITLDKLVLVDINVQRVMNIEVNIIHQAPPLPLDYILFQNYPNPFNPSTSVKFQVPQTSDVTIKIYDMLGQEVRTLFAGEVLRGTYTAEWDGLNDAGVQMSSGSYVYRMIAGEFMQAKKMVYVK